MENLSFESETHNATAWNGTLFKIPTEVWGTIDCQTNNCFEILFYIVASLTFLILVRK
jgi:hypothetical protein